MIALFHSHSGLRYLVLLAALVAAGLHVYGLVTHRPFGRAARIAGSVFVGLFDLQLLVGAALATAMALTGRWYPMLWVHLSSMVLGVAVAHVLLARNKRRAQPGHVQPLVGIVAALGLVVLGIAAIGRTPFAMTIVGTRPAAVDSKIALRSATPEGARVVASEIWAKRCAACHGADGRGDGVAAIALAPHPTDFGDAAWQATATDQGIEAVIREGGAPHGKSAVMPANPDLPETVVKALRELIRARAGR